MATTEMKKSFDRMMRNKRTALRLALVISVLFIQQASASAFYLCEGFSVSTSGKGHCRCCPPDRSPHSRTGDLAMANVKNAHCKAVSKVSWQYRKPDLFKERALSIVGIRTGDSFSTPRVCCQLEKPKAEMIGPIVLLPNVEFVAGSPVAFDSTDIGSALPDPTISYPRSRPLYLFLSSFLI